MFIRALLLYKEEDCVFYRFERVGMTLHKWEDDGKLSEVALRDDAIVSELGLVFISHIKFTIERRKPRYDGRKIIAAVSPFLAFSVFNNNPD